MPKLNDTKLSIRAENDGRTLTIYSGPDLSRKNTFTIKSDCRADCLANLINTIEYPEDLVWLGHLLTTEADGYPCFVSIFTALLIHSSLEKKS